MIDFEPLCHRSLHAAVLAGLVRKVTRGFRVHAGALDVLAAGVEPHDLVVAIDAPNASDAEVSELVRRVCSRLGEAPAALVALVVASPVAVALVAAARADRGVDAASRAEPGAFGRARAWASERVEAPLAPAVSPARLTRIAEGASAGGFVLVEPDLSASLPRLAASRAWRTPLDRAVASTMTLGLTARPVLFAPRASAPKGGAARLRLERVADGWVRLGPAPVGGASSTPLVTAALETLEARRPSAIAFKDLLREARARAALRGERAGSDDARKLGDGLFSLALREHVELFAVDPAAPAWTLTRA